MELVGSRENGGGVVSELTLGQASSLAAMSQLEFQRLLASRQITIHYGVAEFEEDLKTLRELGRL